MSLWEYKVITSGKGGFATPAMMEKFLNDLGRDEWEIVCFQTAPENFLAFTGLARRSTQRDWTLEDAAAAAAKAEAEKLRAEFEAKFKAAASTAAGGEERAPSFLEEKAAPDDGFRKPIDTSRDDEPEAAEEEKDEWDELGQEDELPTFFEAIKPHMRRNQRGPGMSVGVDYLAKKWDQSEDDIKGALLECGFAMPEDEDTKPEYVEYDGDLYWLNINRRGELWINTKEKPRPVFRSVKAQRIEQPEPAPSNANAEGQAKTESGEKAEAQGAKPEGGPEGAATGENAADVGERAPEAPPQPEATETRNGGGGGGSRLPQGADLLRKIRPHMRRNRRGPGGSGSTNFLARALRVKEEELKTAFVTLGLTMPGSSNDKPVYAEFGNEVWWLNMDSRGGLWINGREKRQGEVVGGAAEQTPAGEAPMPVEAVPGSAGPEGVPAPELVPATGAVPTEQPAEAGGTAAGDSTASATSAAASEREREVAPMPAESAVVPQASEASAAGAPAGEAKSSGDVSAVFADVRSLLKETKSGGIAAKIERIADETGKPAEDVLARLTGAGLKVPEKPREKPVFIEHAGDIFWISKNARGELWLNAKASKFADKGEADDEGGSDEESGGSEAAETEGETSGASGEGGEGEPEKKPRRVRSRRKSE